MRLGRRGRRLAIAAPTRTPGMALAFGSVMKTISCRLVFARCRTMCRNCPGKFWCTNRYFTRRRSLREACVWRGSRRPGRLGRARIRSGQLHSGGTLHRRRGRDAAVLPAAWLGSGGRSRRPCRSCGGGRLLRRHGLDVAAAQFDAGSFQRREALGLAGLAGADRADRAAVDEGRRVAAVLLASPRAPFSRSLRPSKRQRHAAAAAELAALDPGRQPAATEHAPGIRCPRRRCRSRGVTAKPSIQRSLPRSPIQSPSCRRHRRCAAHARRYPASRWSPPRSGGGAAPERPVARRGGRRRRRLSRSTCRRGAVSAALARRLVDGHQHLRRALGDPHQRARRAVQPAVVAERADADSIGPAGGARRQARCARPAGRWSRSGGGLPGAWKTQNSPVSSVIRWPETRSSDDSALAIVGGRRRVWLPACGGTAACGVQACARPAVAAVLPWMLTRFLGG